MTRENVEIIMAPAVSVLAPATGVLLIAVGVATPAAGSSTCPDGIAIGETIDGKTVCERLDGTGDLIFLNTDGSEQRRVAKSYSALYDSNASEAYLGFNKSQWGSSSGPDVLGNALISRSTPGDPSCESSCSCVISAVSASLKIFAHSVHRALRCLRRASHALRWWVRRKGSSTRRPQCSTRLAYLRWIARQLRLGGLRHFRDLSVWYGNAEHEVRYCPRANLSLENAVRVAYILPGRAQPVSGQIWPQHRGFQAKDRHAKDQRRPLRRLVAYCLVPLHRGERL